MKKSTNINIIIIVLIIFAGVIIGILACKSNHLFTSKKTTSSKQTNGFNATKINQKNNVTTSGGQGKHSKNTKGHNFQTYTSSDSLWQFSLPQKFPKPQVNTNQTIFRTEDETITVEVKKVSLIPSDFTLQSQESVSIASETGKLQIYLSSQQTNGHPNEEVLLISFRHQNNPYQIIDRFKYSSSVKDNKLKRFQDMASTFKFLK